MGKGTFHCPVDSCETSKRNGTALNNHIRMKAKHNPDGEHSKYYTPPDTNEVQEDSGKGKNIVDDMKEKNQELEEQNNDSLQELEPVEETSEYVDLESVELEKLVENGFGDSVEEAAKQLKKAKKRGFSKVNLETGDLK